MLTLDWPSKASYERRLFQSHDFRIAVDVLDLDERVVGSARFLDGGITIQPPTELVRRTCDLVLSDPAGALDFSKASAWSGTSVWVDRLVRVRHSIVASGREVEAVCFIGPPSILSRAGAEVSITCPDKAALAMRGSVPFTVKEGANAVQAIRAILAQCAGEFRFRFPTSPRRLSRDYSVGLDDAAAPMVVAARIAKAELGMQLLYAADGYALLRVVPTTSSLTVPGVTEQAVSSIDFSTVVNYVKVTGKASTKTTGKTTIKTQPVVVSQLASSSSLSPQALRRKGVPRYLPLVITDDAYTKTDQVKARAERELAAASQLDTTTQFSCIPFFHADADDLVTVGLPGADAVVRLSTGSIPLGVAGDMTIGMTRNVFGRAAHKSRVTTLRWKKVVTGRKKHRKTKWRRI